LRKQLFCALSCAAREHDEPSEVSARRSLAVKQQLPEREGSLRVAI
jgi:hypothetical protein